MNFIYFIVQLISSISYVSQKPCGSNINVCSKNGFFCFVCYRKVYCSLLTLTRLFLVSKLKMQKTNRHIYFSLKNWLFEGIFWRFPISFNEFQKHKGKLLCSINLQTKYFLASISSSYTSVGSSPNITNFELDRPNF